MWSTWQINAGWCAMHRVKCGMHSARTLKIIQGWPSKFPQFYNQFDNAAMTQFTFDFQNNLMYFKVFVISQTWTNEYFGYQCLLCLMDIIDKKRFSPVTICSL